MKERIIAIGEVLAYVIWRGFGIFLYILGGSAAAGAAVTGDLFTGVYIAWLTLMLGIIGAIGYSIAVTGAASKETVHMAANDAIKKFDEKNGKESKPAKTDEEQF
jgi:energy-converting hydrogenase Eha subunit H